MPATDTPETTPPTTASARDDDRRRPRNRRSPTAPTTPEPEPTPAAGDETTAIEPTDVPDRLDAGDHRAQPTRPTARPTTSSTPCHDGGPRRVVTRPIAFPVLGPVRYSNDWGACRDGCARRHQGTDMLGVRMQPLLAAVDGTVTRIRYENAGTAGAVITVTGADGWYYNYFHVNNDTPGTDDGARRTGVAGRSRA